MSPRPPQPLGDEQGRWYVSVPTAGDLIEMESRKDDPEAVLWYVSRFLVNADGTYVVRDQAEARTVPANLATAVVLKVQELLAARP